jgi:hypothetical protein
MRRSPSSHREGEDAHSVLVRELGNACLTRDVVALARLLALDVVVIVDGGGAPAITSDPARGVRDGLRLLLRVLTALDAASITENSVNGQPGIVLSCRGIVVGIVCVAIGRSTERAERVWVVANPDKLCAWNSG